MWVKNNNGSWWIHVKERISTSVAHSGGGGGGGGGESTVNSPQIQLTKVK